jgi:WD40 repeat protein
MQTPAGIAINSKSVAFSSDGKRFACSGESGLVTILDALTGAEIVNCARCPAIIDFIAFSPDGGRVSGSGHTKKSVGGLRIWDAVNGKEILALHGKGGGEVTLAFSPDGKMVASGSNSAVSVWDANTGKLIHEFNMGSSGNGTICAVAFSADAQRIATGGSGPTGIVKIWDAASGEEVLTVPSIGTRAVAFSPDGTRLATGCTDKFVRIWDAHSGREILALTGHTASVDFVAFSPNGNGLASLSHEGTAVRLWDGSPP